MVKIETEGVSGDTDIHPPLAGKQKGLGQLMRNLEFRQVAAQGQASGSGPGICEDMRVV